MDKLKEIKKLVDQQAEDEGLWFIAETVTEAYLQLHFRILHKKIEDKWRELGGKHDTK